MQEQPSQMFCKKLFKKFPLRACNFIKNRLQHRCFSVNIAKFLRTSILKNICERLFLTLQSSVKKKQAEKRPNNHSHAFDSYQIQIAFIGYSLREMCPNKEFFLVRVFPHSDWIRRDTSYLSVVSPNARKYGPVKTPYLDTFHAVMLLDILLKKTCFQL